MSSSSAPSGATTRKKARSSIGSIGLSRRHRPLPGRPQRRPYPRHRWQDLQARAVAFGHRSPRQTVRHRQRRRARSAIIWPPRSRSCAPRAIEVTPDNLKIAENTPLILSLHRDLDAHRESATTAGVKIGTTKRGIGPAYEDKIGRRAIHLMDLTEPDELDDKIARLLAHHDPALARAWPRPAGGGGDPRGTAWRSRQSFCLSWRRPSTCSIVSDARANAFSSRARRAPCSTSTTAPIPL